MNQTESQLQRSVARYLDLCGLDWCAVPNGGKRNVITASIMKAEGVKRGVPDILIFNQCLSGSERGLAIELKSGKNKPTEHQLEWHRKLRKCNWRVEVLRSFDEVMSVIKECYPNNRCSIQ